MIFFRKKYFTIFLLLPLIFLYRFDLILYAEPMADPVGEVFLMHFFGGSYKLDQLDLSVSVLGLLGLVFLNLLFTDYLIQDVFVNAEYIFTRFQNRFCWYYRKIIGVILYSSLGILLYMSLYVANAVWTSEYAVTKKDLGVLISVFVILTLFTYFSVVLINLLALRFGNTIGFIITYSVLIVSTIFTMHLQEDPDKIMTQLLHRLNPMSNILISWNFSDAHVLWGIGYYFIVSVVISWLLWLKIRSMEIGIRVRAEVS